MCPQDLTIPKTQSLNNCSLQKRPQKRFIGSPLPELCKRCFSLWSSNIPPNRFVLSLLSHDLLTGFLHNRTKKTTHPTLSPPTSGAFGSALNATLPYFIELLVGCCRTPPQCLMMDSCIRDAHFGRGLEREVFFVLADSVEVEISSRGRRTLWVLLCVWQLLIDLFTRLFFKADLEAALSLTVRSIFQPRSEILTVGF